VFDSKNPGEPLIDGITEEVVEEDESIYIIKIIKNTMLQKIRCYKKYDVTKNTMLQKIRCYKKYDVTKNTMLQYKYLIKHPVKVS
jgi:hypothetical protein